MKRNSFLLIALLTFGISLTSCSIFNNSNANNHRSTSGKSNNQSTVVEDGTFIYNGSSVKALNKDISGDLVIPETYNGVSITTIPEGAFSNCSKIKSIVLPNTITSIAQGAFAGCITLESITVPYVGLTPDKTKDGGHFGQIFGTSSYTGGTKVESYYGKYDSHYYYIPSSLRKVTVTDATTLVYGAFQNVSMLTEINLNDDIIAIGSFAFAGLNQIKTMNLPSIYTLPSSAFDGCTKLTNFVIGKNMTKIEENAFNGCMNLLTINSELEGEFVIPENVNEIYDGAFKNCLHVTKITLPFIGNSDSKTSDGGHFGRIFGTSSYTGSTKVESYYGKYDSHYYYIPSGLREVTITNATHVVYGAFQNVSMITSLRINSAAQNSIGTDAFKNCVEPVWF